jgi:S-DNA-T family DNA segregation ATPase FtsK/SpoIIIE
LKNKINKKSSKTPTRKFLSQASREAILLFSLSISLFIYLTLTTYNSEDSSWINSSSSDIQNLGGLFGSYLSETLYFIFGQGAFLIPLIIIFSSILIYNKGRYNEDNNVFIRYIGYLFFLVSVCSLLSIHSANSNLEAGPGGLVGDFIASILVINLSIVGSTILLVTFLITGLTLWLKLSWLKIFEHIGAYGFKFRDVIFDLFKKIILQIIKDKNTIDYKKDVEFKKKLEKLKKVDDIKIEPEVKVTKFSDRIDKEKQIPLFENKSNSKIPPLSLLNDPDEEVSSYSEETLKTLSKLVEIKLEDYGVRASVVAVHQGPVITRFELEPEAGVKAGKITGLSKDLARALSVTNVRVVEVIPGKNVIGIEIPNENKQIVRLSEILKTASFENFNSKLTIGMGKDISGEPVMADLSKMPHLLVAGTTGSGKSVAINSMILSLIYKSSPEHVRMIMIDPKMLELGIYDGIPHLLTPVVTDMNLAANALMWSVKEMERRYKLLAKYSVRNIDGFNSKVTKDDSIDEEYLPQIVIVVDEFADLFFVVGKKIEELIARLAQKARAAGIHLILATQRPSVDVITGLIKANIPSRVAFQVSSKTDSRVILDQSGAENLLGNGDMLYLESGKMIPDRIHGAFVSDKEVKDVINYLKEGVENEYIEEILENNNTGDLKDLYSNSENDDDDSLYNEAVQIVVENDKASISYLQRRLKIGYNRAARMIEKMEEMGIVTSIQKNGTRNVIKK